MENSGDADHFGGLGVRLCSPKVAFAIATVGNRPQPSATLHRGMLPEWSRKCVKFIRGLAILLVFAEEVRCE